MAAPFLWLLVGPNGAGKSTYYERVIAPHLKAPFVNADLIARARWPVNYANHGYDAARLAAQTRDRLVAARKTFVAETVFSHASKLDMLDHAKAAGYVVWLTFVNVASPDLAVARVGQRMREGGHPVPPDKVRGRYARLTDNVLRAVETVDRLNVIDNSGKGQALCDVLLFDRGHLVWRAKALPDWVQSLFEEQLEPPI